jgi:NAD(P)-dependent dehydrogenase (short-subunit alcohol dehydrogenase family)
VLITGAGTGIGRHAAESLARNGYTVLAGIRFSSEEEEIKSVRLSTLIPFYLDVCKHEACVDAVKRIEILTKSFDLPFVALINNAGFLKSLPIEHHNLQEARLMFETNFFAAMNLIQLFLPLLRESQGRIINVSSFTALAGIKSLPFYFFVSLSLSVSLICFSLGPPLGGVYAATKGAIESFSDSLRREIARFGVSVSVIQPCYVATNLLSTASAENSQGGPSPSPSHTSSQLQPPARISGSVDHRALYAHLYTPQIEAIIRYCISCASHPQHTTTAIQVR